ncbi:ABC transporter permease [Cryptosporangium minutisporangium]
MTTDVTKPGSTYPASIEALLPRARELASALGSLPSRNKLMQELRIGAPKAGALRDVLTSEAPTGRETGMGRLHLVTADESDPVPVEVAPAPIETTTVTVEPSAPIQATPTPEASPQISEDGHPGTPTHEETPTTGRVPRSWPVLLLAFGAFVTIWSGWVGLGELTGFGIVHPLPGIWDEFELNTAITLPIGMEAYAAYALRAWLSPAVPPRARRFAKWSAIGSLTLGALGQIAYHQMAAANVTQAPWPITTLVACLPVAVLGMGAALAHLLHDR